MITLRNKLMHYGTTGNLKELQKYISTIKLKTAIDFLSSIWMYSDAAQLIQFLFEGFNETPSAMELRQEVAKYMLEQMGSKVLTTDAQHSIISVLCNELKRFPIKHLVELTSVSIDMVHLGDPDTNWIWSRVLPMLISLLVVKNTINYEGVDYNGSGFKTEIINALCRVRWPSEIIICLASMFGQMELSKEEYHKVCNKLCVNMFRIKPSSIPPLIHQLLKLCEIYGDIYPIFSLCYYFSVILHKDPQYEVFKQSSDIGNISASINELKQSEQMVLFHVQSVVTTSSQCSWISNFLQSLRTINRWPNFVLSTFPMMLLLVLASSEDLQIVIYEIIKVALLRRIKISKLISQAAWLRETINESKSTDKLFSRLIEISVKENVLITQGLIGFAMNLLHHSGDYAKEVHNIGITILLKLSSKHKNLAPSILSQLMNNIDDERCELQYSYCLFNMIDYIPLTLIQNQDIILHGILKASEISQKYILRSIMPLITYSPPMRDSIIMLIRKNVFMSDNTLVREMGAYGLCLLIENLRVDLPNCASLSQQTLLARNSSFFTQTRNSQMNDQTKELTCNSTSFETICLEILAILKYSMRKQGSNQLNKLEIYKGLITAVEKNPPVCSNILEILFENLQHYILGNDENIINFDRFLNVVDNNIKATDSIGHLITCITFVLAKALDTEESLSNNRTFEQILEKLNTLCEKMKDCNLTAYGLKKDCDTSDGLNIMRSTEILNQLIMIQESLFIYKISLWTTESAEESENIISSLFKTYKTLIEHSKTMFSKNKKQTRKNKANNSDSKLQQNNPAVKFKLPKTLLTLPTLTKLIKILYSKAGKNYSKNLRANTDFHQHTLQAVLIILQDIDKSLDMAERDSKEQIFTLLSQCGTIIHKNCLPKLKVLSDFDLLTATLSAEVFLKIIQLIDKHYKKEFIEFISKLHPDQNKGNMQDLIRLTISKFKDVLNIYLQDEEILDKDSRIAISLIHDIQILSKHLSVSEDSLFFNMMTVEGLRLLLVDIKNNGIAVAKALFGFFITFDAQIRVASTFCSDAATQVCSILGTINEEQVNSSNALSVINEATFEVIVQILCDNCKEDLSQIDWVVQYINAYYAVCVNIQNYNSSFDCEYLEEKESSICTHLCHIIRILYTLSNSQLPTGISTDALFKALQSLYETLSNLAKYFLKRVIRSSLAFMKARFEKVVKLAGKKLCVTVYKLITHVEEIQDKKHKSKVLRQTKNIPNLVFAMEVFKKSIIQLSMKTNALGKEVLISGLNIGTTRDFRLHLETLQEALNNAATDETNGTIISETDVDSIIESSTSETRNEPAQKRLKY